MGPDELDDLLASIRAESKRDSALALYKGTRGTDLVSEKIDERILNLLGLEDVFDIDYATYVSLLKERAVAARMTGKNLSTDESELVTNEFKRVKGKVGRFKIKKQKIKTGSIGTASTKISKDKFFLIGTTSVAPSLASSGIAADLGSGIKDINEKLDELLKSIIGQSDEEKKRAELERKESEKKKRAERESSLEGAKKSVKSIKNVAKKIISPFQDILDRIFKFIKFTLFGFAFNQFINWFSDPKNKKKIEVLGRFLKDFWPILSVAALKFLTPFGGFVSGTLGLLKLFGGKLLAFMVANPVATAALGAGIGAYTLEQQISSRRKEAKKLDPSIVTPEDTAGTGKLPKMSQLYDEQFQRGIAFNNGGIIPKMPLLNHPTNIRDIAFNDGGFIDEETGLNITGAGPDTQLIAAQPGEIVISKKAVDKYGANFFLGMNKNAGGTNVPKMVNNIQLAQGGGMIGGFGRVMAPRTGGQNTWASRGARSVFQMFGMNVPGTEKSTTYSSSDVNRYNTLNKTRTIQTGNSYHSLSNGGFGLSPTIMTVPKKTGSSKSPLRNFGSNVRTVRGAIQRQTKIMREMGYEPDGYDTFFKRHSAVMGPQSRAVPVGTPVINSRTQMIVLPPIKETAKVNSTPVKSGTDIPDFKITSSSPVRMSVAQSLGISDLV